MSGVASSGQSAASAPVRLAEALSPSAAAQTAAAAKGVGRLDNVSRVESRGGRRAGLRGRGRESLATQAFGDLAQSLAGAQTLRPAAMRRQLEALQSEIQKLQDEEPEDLFELALGALEDEIKHAERLQAVLQSIARR